MFFFFGKESPLNPLLTASRLVTFPAKSYLNRAPKYISTFDEPSPTARLKASHIPGTPRLPSFSINPFSFHGIPTLFFIFFFSINQHTFTEYKVFSLYHGDFMFKTNLISTLRS